MKDFFRKFLAGVIPPGCIHCKRQLSFGEEVYCLECIYEMPLTEFSDPVSNPVFRQLMGLSGFEAATSLCYYSANGIISDSIRSLKYHNRIHIGFYLGKMLGKMLCEKLPFNTADVIVPVPLHESKIRKRGFNQSQVIAEGVASVLNKPVVCNLLKRKLKSRSQTKKNRISRSLELNRSFELGDHQVSGYKILVIDDVITTGSTLSACSHPFIGLKDVNLFAASVAFTRK